MLIYSIYFLIFARFYALIGYLLNKEDSCKDTQNSRQIFHAKTIDEELAGIGCEQIARRVGFQHRSPKKISATNFVKALIRMALIPIVSLNTLAMLISLFSNQKVSKQGVDKRVGPAAILLIREVLASALYQVSKRISLRERGFFSAFNRVLVQDSTNIRLPDHMSSLFPGSRNQNGPTASILKIQLVYDLLGESLCDLGISGFTRNDQEASRDILDYAQPGDLVLRDLGYFSTPVFRAMEQKGISFISRLRNRVALYDPDTGERLDLIKELKKSNKLDRTVLVGSKEKLALRLVATPVPDEIANERRRKLKTQSGKRNSPKKAVLQLLGWEIFITNVPENIWSTKAASKVYFSRWRVELVFKVWKSHFRMASFPNGSRTLVLICILAKLLHMIWFHQRYSLANKWAIAMEGQFLSMQKVADLANVLSLFGSSFSEAIIGNQLIKDVLVSLCSYDKRRRLNHFQTVQALS